MRYLIILILLSSCSASNLLSRAIKKDPSIITEKVVIIEKEVPGVFIDTTAIDTLLIDNDRISLTAIAKGKIDLSYYIKPVQIIDTTTVKEVNIPEKPSVAKVKARQDGKTARKKIAQDGKTNRSTQKSKAKETKYKEKKTKWYNWLLIGIAIGFILNTVLKFLWKRFIP